MGVIRPGSSKKSRPKPDAPDGPVKALILPVKPVEQLKMSGTLIRVVFGGRHCFVIGWHCVETEKVLALKSTLDEAATLPR